MLGCLVWLLWILPCSLFSAEPWPCPRRTSRGGANLVRSTKDKPDSLGPWQFRNSRHSWGYVQRMKVWTSAAVLESKDDVLVYAGSYDGNLYCLDASRGEMKWSFTTGGKIQAEPIIGQLNGQNIVLIGSTDRTLYALAAATGRLEWKYQAVPWRPTLGGGNLASPCLANRHGRLVVAAPVWAYDRSIGNNLQLSELHLLDVESGKLIWKIELGMTPPTGAIAVETSLGPAILVAIESGILQAILVENGQKIWSFSSGGLVLGTPSSAVVNGKRLAFLGSKYNFIHAIDVETGQEVWKFRAGMWIDSSPAVARVGGRDLVIFGSYDYYLYALAAEEGNLVWKKKLGGAVYSSAAFLPRDGVDEYVFVSSWDDALYCLETATGTIVWKRYIGRAIWDGIPLGESTWASPVVLAAGLKSTVLIGSYSGWFLSEPVWKPGGDIANLGRTAGNVWVGLIASVLLTTAVVTVIMTKRGLKKTASG